MWVRTSLLAKLLLGILISTLIPLTMFIIISYRSTTSSVQNQVIHLNQQAMESSIYYLKQYLDDLNQTSITFYFDPQMMSYLRTGATTDYNRRMYISNQVYTLAKGRPEFRAVSFIDSRSGDVITDSTFLRLGAGYELGTASTMEEDRAGWTETHGIEVVSVNGTTLLAYHKPIIDYPRSTVLGVLSIYVASDQFERLVRPFTGSETAEDGNVFLLIRQDRKLLYSSATTNNPHDLIEIEALEQSSKYGYQESQWNDQQGVFVYVNDEYKGIPLTQVKFIPKSVMNEAANRALKESLLIPFIMIGIVLLCSIVLSYFLISPIKRLVRSMATVQSGNFEIPPISPRMDELGVLEQRFHSMVRGLDDLMNREYRNRLELSTARLKMLQAQINPHFLYNSLQSIGTLALRRGVTEINDKIVDLGSIMRYSMDISTETVPLHMEIEHIEHYLSLQSGRFKNKLFYSLSCPEEALHIEVPKMILQPLVENSIIHGIEDGNGTGEVAVSIEFGEALIIRVADTGRGMQEEKIAQIRKAYGGKHTAEHQRGIGLLNVLERLRLRYGSEFTWEISSIPYEQTVITLHIPVIRSASEETARMEPGEEGAE